MNGFSVVALPREIRQVAISCVLASLFCVVAGVAFLLGPWPEQTRIRFDGGMSLSLIQQSFVLLVPGIVGIVALLLLPFRPQLSLALFAAQAMLIAAITVTVLVAAANLSMMLFALTALIGGIILVQIVLDLRKLRSPAVKAYVQRKSSN